MIYQKYIREIPNFSELLEFTMKDPYNENYGGYKMNTEILEKLMEESNIKSYYKLAKELEVPYTTLLDLVHGKVLKTMTIKTVAEYFHVTLDMLVEPTTYYNVINEDDLLKSYLPIKKEEQNHLFYLLAN